MPFDHNISTFTPSKHQRWYHVHVHATFRKSFVHPEEDASPQIARSQEELESFLHSD